MLDRLVPLVVTLTSGMYLLQAMALPFGSAARPGAGFYPVLVAVFACVVGLIATAQAFLGPAVVRVADEVAEDAPARRRRVGACLLSLAAFSLTLPWIGYPIAAGAFVTLMLRGLGSAWRRALLTGVASAAGSWYLFAALLDVPLPRGVWW